MFAAFSLGWSEVICVSVFAVIVLASLGILAYLLVRNAGLNPITKEKVVEEPPTPSQFPVLAEGVSHADMVAKIARRFCPKCRSVLTSDSPEGLCAPCLLAGGLSANGDTRASNDSATSPPSADIATLQALLPQLEILELLGQGGMGSVYKARQKSLDRIVALKLIRPDSASDPAFENRFEREAKSLAKLNHPNIVTVHDFGKAGDVFYLVMEFVDGVNLRQTMRAGRLSPHEALAIVPQICDALQFAHDHGIVHRDIKPENVLLDRHGRVKIADFGLAKLLGINLDSVALTLTQNAVGTPRYMAPEQIDHPMTVDHRADIYSLGVVIYEMLTGELPVGHFPLPSERVQVDVRIDEVVLRALAKEPEKRFQKASQVKSGLASAGSWPSPPPKLGPVVAQLLPDRRAVAARLVRGPAIGLMATGVLGILPLLVVPLVSLGGYVARSSSSDQLACFTGLAVPVWSTCPQTVALSAPMILAQSSSFLQGRPTWLGLLIGTAVLVSLVPSVLILVGGWQMRQLESYGLAMIAAIVALIPFCTAFGWPLGLPMGIWALAVLSRREVRDAFGS